uniref:V-ATPase 14 kDa subunit n=1 Tax=Falco tinnunculus TaxID=100819 RepID=A0A8C4UB81_FALTI
MIRGSFLNREDIGIILISQCLAELIQHAVEAHARPLPTILEIPSKEHPYDPAKDSVLRRARGVFSPEDLR